MTVSLLEQTVTINGLAYAVSDCLIDEALGAALAISFAVDGPTNAALPRPRLGDEVLVVQNCDGTQTYRGAITAVNALRAQGAFQLKVEATGGERGAAITRRYRILNEGPLGDQFRDLWDTGATIPGVVGLSDNVPGPGEGPVMPAHSLTYGSLADYMEWVQRTAGWFWRIDSDRRLELFDPTDLVANPARPLALQDFEEESLSVRVDMTVVNVARKQAWLRRVLRATGRPDSLFQQCIRSIQVPPDAPPVDEGSLWELENAELITGASFPDDTPREEIELRISDGVIEFNPPVRTSPAPVVELTYRTLVWVERSDPASIAQYGRREGPPLPHDGASGIPEAHATLAQYLQSKALPEVTLSGILLRSDIRPGAVVQVQLPDISDERTFLIERVRRSTAGTELEVRITGKTLGEDVVNPAAPPRVVVINPSPVHEIVRRTINLEMRGMSPLTLAGRVAELIGPVPLPQTVPLGPFEWTSYFEVEPLEVAQEAVTGWLSEFEFALLDPGLLYLALTEDRLVADTSDELVIKTES